MAVLPIVKHPDKRLESKCKKVEVFDKKLAKLLDDMYDTMIEADGVGLAAPQIGKNIQVAIVDVDDESGTIELINPELIESNGKDSDIEGCLSFPGIYGEVERPTFVKVQAQDRFGRWCVIEAEDYMARAILHEMDHLEGVLFTSKVSRYVSEEELEGYEAE